MVVEGNEGKGGGACELTAEELKEFRRLLLEKRRDLLGDLTGMTAEAKGAGPGEAEADAVQEQPKYADESDDREITIGLLASERLLLSEISEALDRMEKGTYGVCVATGEPIGKNRLLARPWAKYCITYARTMEQKGKPNGAGPRWRFEPEGFGDNGEDKNDEPTDVRALASGDDD